MRITNQVVRFSLYIWNPSPPLRFPPAVLPSSIHQQNRCAPSTCSYPHHEDRRRCPWETTLATVSPFLLPISPGRAKSAFPGGMSTELVPGRLSWGGAFPRLLCHRRQQNRAYDAMAFRTEVADETQSAGYRASLQRRRLAPGGAPSVEEVCPSL